jgi:site-specific recombinase XerD
MYSPSKGCFFILYVYENVNGGEAKVAVLDNNMMIIKPIYEYLRWIKTNGLEPNTIVAYAHDLKTYFEFLNFKGYNPLPIMPEMLHELKIYLHEPFHHKKVYHADELLEQPKRKSVTVNRILGTVYSFYEWMDFFINEDKPIINNKLDKTREVVSVFGELFKIANRKGKTLKSYFKVRHRENDESAEDKIDGFRILNESDYKMVLNALDNKRDKLLFKFLYFSGARISSALSLTIESIPRPDYDHKWTVLRIKEPKNTNRRQQLKSGSHKVFVPTDLIEEIDNYIMEQRIRINCGHRFLFIALNKKDFGHVLTREAVGKKYTKIAKQLGIAHFTPHTLRHTCCTNLLAAGVSVHTVQKIMNHKQLATTMKYEHIGNEHVLRELDGYWNGISIFTERKVVEEAK